jgi:predicted secreted protein
MVFEHLRIDLSQQEVEQQYYRQDVQQSTQSRAWLTSNLRALTWSQSMPSKKRRCSFFQVFGRGKNASLSCTTFCDQAPENGESRTYRAQASQSTKTVARPTVILDPSDNQLCSSKIGAPRASTTSIVDDDASEPTSRSRSSNSLTGMNHSIQCKRNKKADFKSRIQFLRLGRASRERYIDSSLPLCYTFP